MFGGRVAFTFVKDLVVVLDCWFAQSVKVRVVGADVVVLRGCTVLGRLEVEGCGRVQVEECRVSEFRVGACGRVGVKETDVNTLLVAECGKVEFVDVRDKGEGFSGGGEVGGDMDGDGDGGGDVNGDDGNDENDDGGSGDSGSDGDDGDSSDGGVDISC